MFWALVRLSVQVSTVIGSIPRNLFVNNENFSGSWELSMNTAYDENRIVFVPTSSSDRYGYAWRLARAPPTVWNATFRFQVTNTSTYTKGGVFMTSEFGPQGEIFGGPEKFDGAALLFEIKNGFIAYEYRVNNGKVVYTDSDIMAFVTLQLYGDEFAVHLAFSDDGNVKIESNIMNRHVTIYQGTARTSVKKCWIAVTAECVENTGELSLMGVKSSFGTSDEAEEEEAPEEPVGQVDVKSVEGILDQIMVVANAVNRSAKLRFVHDAVDKAMFKHTDSWRRRSYTMIDDTKELKETLMQQLVFVQDSMDDFRMTIKQRLDRMKTTAKNLCRELYLAMFSITEDLKNPVDKGVMTAVAFVIEFIGIAEACALAVLGIRFLRNSRKATL